MIRNGCDSKTTERVARGLRVIRAVVCGAVLVLFSGCTTGTSGGAKSGLFDRFDKKEKASGTAAMKPVVVCPTCSVPVGVAANGSQAAVPPVPGATVTAEAQDNVAANTQQAAVGTSSQPTEQMQSMPSIPQVPPEGAATHGMVPDTTTGGGQPNVQLTWEQSQAAHLRNQQATQTPPVQTFPANQMAPAQNAMPGQIPAQQAACAPGTTAAKSFAGQWYDSTQPGSSNDGGVCPPAPVQAQLQDCKDEIAQLRSEMARMEADRKKSEEKDQILAIKQQQLEEQNRKLQEAQKRMDQADIEQLDALNELAEGILPAESIPDQPQPQASNRTNAPIRSASRSRVQSASRPQPRRVTLPSVDE